MEASGLKTPDMSTSSLEEPNYWPHSEQDINEVANTLRSGRESTALLPVQTNLRDTTELPRGKPALPEELIRIILREAEYFLRLSNSKEAFVQCQQETAWQPYLESKPLSRRLPRVDIAVTGHDQGWASDSSVAYSFYDLGSISGPGSELTRGPRLFGNEPANRNKQVSYISQVHSVHRLTVVFYRLASSSILLSTPQIRK